MNIDFEVVYEIEKKLIKAGVPFHNRADRFATAIYPQLYKRECNDSLGDPQHLALQALYREKFPQGSLGWKPQITGFVASLDRVIKFEIYNYAGHPIIEPYKLLKLEGLAEFNDFYFGDEKIYDEIVDSIEEFIEFGLISLKGKNAFELESSLWREARNHVELIAYGLVNSFENSTIYQNIHLLAELTIKAVLLNNGVEKGKLSDNKIGGHNLKNLITLLPNADHAKKESLIGHIADFPDYVQSRYNGLDKKYKFIDVVKFSSRVRNFIADVIKLSTYYQENPPHLLIKRK